MTGSACYFAELPRQTVAVHIASKVSLSVFRFVTVPVG